VTLERARFFRIQRFRLATIGQVVRIDDIVEAIGGLLMNDDMSAVIELLRDLLPDPTPAQEATLSELEVKYRAGVAARNNRPA